jgi:saccharopine dehydrogenase (NAD+, L-lysine-forming)
MMLKNIKASKIKIGIIREGRIPTDRRTPITPRNCVELKELYPNLEIVVQPSKIRTILDEEYKALGIPIQEDLTDCDYIFGIKQVHPSELIEGKTYLFFSHTIKKQPDNQKLIIEILRKKCTLIDYECIKDPKGNRLTSFGYFAGLVGAYNTILTYGHRYRLFDLKPAHLCFDYAEMRSYFKKVKLKPIKIALTGGGRVANGAIQVLTQMKIKEVNLNDFINKEYSNPVYCQIRSEHFNVKRGTNFFDKKDFFKNPELYTSTFFEFAKKADILMACAFWNPKAPKLFTKEQMRSSDFHIKVIGDITCDVGGSIPGTLKSTSIDNPVYDYNPFSEDLEVPYSNERNVTTMAIDNLPCELSRDASEDFGRQLINRVFPLLLHHDEENIIENATIAKSGSLTEKYGYLKDYAGL